MKKWIIGSAFVLILALLVFRIFYKQVDHVKTERLWYVKQLHFDFSGKVDSIKTFRNERGLLHFHMTRGTYDTLQERRLNSQLTRNRELRFIRSGTTRGKLSIFMENIDKFAPGDSLMVNTGDNIIRVYRQHTQIHETKSTDALSGRGF